jgi:hypothetical protein
LRNPEDHIVTAALVQETSETRTGYYHMHDQIGPTLEQRVATGYVEGEHNTFTRDEYDDFDDGSKKRYHEAMVQAVLEGLE